MTVLDTAPEGPASGQLRGRDRLRQLPAIGLRRLLPIADVLVGAVLSTFANGLRGSAVLMAAVYVVGCRWAGLHRPRLNPTLLEELPRLLGVLIGTTGVVLVVRAVIDDGTVSEQFLRLVAFEALGVVLGRAAVYSLVRQARASGLVAHRTLILGCDDVGADLARSLRDHPEYGLRPVGFLEDRGSRATKPLTVPLLGPLDRLTEVVEKERVNSIIVVFPDAPLPRLVQALRLGCSSDAQVFVVPRLFEVHTQHYLGDTVRGVPLIRLHRSGMDNGAWVAKRTFDLLVSVWALLLVAPVMGLIALGLRLESGPGVLFRQERVGRHGRRFDVLKFRTLKPVDDAESATRWTVAHDDRLTRFGSFLRSSSLDELPQLWNILRGDMTLVGPRPERPHFVDKFSGEHPDYASRHRMPAGLTGWAAVNGLRGDTSISERARYDNYYIENWSLWLDLTILLRTVGSVFRRSGA